MEKETEETSEVVLVVEVRPFDDSEEMDEAALYQLRGELEDSGWATTPLDTPSEAHTKGAGLLAGLAVGIASGKGHLPHLVSTIRRWLGRTQGRTIEITIAGDKLRITAYSDQTEAALVEAWIGRHRVTGA